MDSMATVIQGLLELGGIILILFMGCGLIIITLKGGKLS